MCKSFHSLEDGIVKKTFKSMKIHAFAPVMSICICGLKPDIKNSYCKPLTASEEELEHNPS